MSAIPPANVASSHSATPLPASRGTGAAQPGHPFAEAMRSAVSSARPAAKTLGSAGASGVSRSQSDRSKITAASNSTRRGQPVSAPSSQPPSGNLARLASSSDGQYANSLDNVDSPSIHADAVATSPLDGQAQKSVITTTVEEQSSGSESRRVRTPGEQSGSSTSDTHRKQTLLVKNADASPSASGPSTIAAATSLTLASIAAIVPQVPVVKIPAAAPTGPDAATASASGTRPTDVDRTTKGLFLSNSAMVPESTSRIPLADVPAAATAVVPNEAGISADGNHVSEHSAAALRGKPTDDNSAAASSAATTANTTATSAGNQNSGNVQASTAHQAASVMDVISTRAVTPGISSSPDDANNSNAASVTDGGNSGANGASIMDKNPSSIGAHSGDGPKTSSLTASIPPVTTDAKDLRGPQPNHADAGAGLQNITSIFSSLGHSGVAGSSTQSTAGSASDHAATSDAFTALDSAASGDRGVLLHVAPHQVAFGVSDPSLGWVEVRAERVSGQISAALTANSAASHAALSSVLPTMATYLQEHQAGVHHVHVETSLGSQTGTGSNGQASPQNQARTAPGNLKLAAAASNLWNAAPVRSAAVATGQRNNFLHEGRFSIRA
jgi:hypothetical protein